MKKLLSMFAVMVASCVANAATLGTVMVQTNSGAVAYPTNFISANMIVTTNMFNGISNRVVVLESYTSRVVALEGQTNSYASQTQYEAVSNRVTVLETNVNSETYNIAVFGSNTAIIVSNLLGTVVDGQSITNMIGSVLSTGTVFEATVLDGVTRTALTNGFLVQSDLGSYLTNNHENASLSGTTTITNLDVNGTTTMRGIVSLDGTVERIGSGANYYELFRSGSSGLFTIFATQSGFGGYDFQDENNESMLYIQRSGLGGYVGIHTNSPTTDLDVNGSALIRTNLTVNGELNVLGGGNVLTNNHMNTTLTSTTKVDRLEIDGFIDFWTSDGGPWAYCSVGGLSTLNFLSTDDGSANETLMSLDFANWEMNVKNFAVVSNTAMYGNLNVGGAQTNTGSLTVHGGGNVVTNRGAIVNNQYVTNGANITVGTMTSAWSVAYSDANTNTVMLPLPVAGYVLKSQGAGAAPIWDINTTYATNLPIGTLIATNEALPGQFFQYSEGSYLGVVTGRFASGIGVGDFTSDGSVPMTGNLNHGGYRATNMANGVLAQDAVTVSQLNSATSTLVTATITNGLDTVAARVAAINSATQNLVTATVTNGLATVAYVDAATNGIRSITNGLATVAYVDAATNTLRSITNGLATVTYVDTATNTLRAITNGLDTVVSVDAKTNTLRAYVAANFATNAGAAGAGYYAMSNGTWTSFTGGSSTDGATVTSIVSSVISTGTVYNANRLGNVVAASYITNNQANVTLSNLTATGTMTIGGVARTTWPENSGTGVRVETHIGPLQWAGTAVSEDGEYIYAIEKVGTHAVWRSSDRGSNFTETAVAANAGAIACSADGSIVAFSGDGSAGALFIYVSTDYGATWTPRASSLAWSCIAMSTNGTKMLAAVGNRGISTSTGGRIYVSVNSGTSWTARGPTAPAATYGFMAVAASYDGTRMFAATYNGGIYRSTDSGTTWGSVSGPSTVADLACSSNGQYVIAVAGNSAAPQLSSDYGATWTALSYLPTFYGSGCGMSSDGQKIVIGSAVTLASQINPIFRSTDYGTSWKGISGVLGDYEVTDCIAMTPDGTFIVAGPLSAFLQTITLNPEANDSVAYATLAGTAVNAQQLGGIVAASYITNGQASVNFTGTHTVSNITATGIINGKNMQENGTNLYAKIVADDAVIFAGQDTVGNVTSSGSDAGKYLKADGTWDTPAGSGDASKAANQTFTGTNTFTVAPYMIGSITESTQLVTKAYVDSATSTLVTATVTNGLDTVVARNLAIDSATSTLVTATITNGLDTVAARTAADLLGSNYVQATATAISNSLTGIVIPTSTVARAGTADTFTLTSNANGAGYSITNVNEVSVTGKVTAAVLQAPTSAGWALKANNGDTCVSGGAGGGCNVTFADGSTFNGLVTANGGITATGAVNFAYATKTGTNPAPTGADFATMDDIGDAVAGLLETTVYGATNQHPVLGAGYASFYSTVPTDLWTNSYALGTSYALVGNRFMTNAIASGTIIPAGSVFNHHVNANVSALNGGVYYSRLVLVKSDLTATQEIDTGSQVVPSLTATELDSVCISTAQVTVAAGTWYLGVERYGKRDSGSAVTLNIYGGNGSPTRLEIPAGIVGGGNLVASDSYKLGGIAAASYITNLSAGVTDPWHQSSNVTSYSMSTLTVSRAMGEHIAWSLTNNATLCVDRSTYPTNGASFVQVSLYIGAYSLTFCTNSISTNAATGNPPGSGGVTLTNNAWNSVILHNPYGSSNVAWGIRQ